jgi:hypothetical protein
MGHSWDRNATWVTAALLACFVSSSRGDSPEPPNLHCQCVLATAGCPLKVFDELAGKPRQSWYQRYTPPNAAAETAHNRALACWRKRDAGGLGDGLCCSSANDDSDADRYFRGDPTNAAK